MRFLKYFVFTAIFILLSCQFSIAQKSVAIKGNNPPLELQFPVACEVNSNCWIVNYPDNVSDEFSKDYKGGDITYDAKNGIDVAVNTTEELKNGISILAAQGGIVQYTRGNLEDNFAESTLRDSGNTPFCGNSVIIEHNKGWKTVYCHLKKGSITVKAGENIGAGRKIAEMGLSGTTDFAHLNFLVFHNGNYFDPFSGLRLNKEGDKLQYKPFWKPYVFDKLTYKKVLITNIGVSIEPPHIENIKSGKYKNVEILNHVPSIFLWGYGFHLKKGDFLKISLKNPDNIKILDKIVKIKKSSEEHSFYAEKFNNQDLWQAGTYEGKIELIRLTSNFTKDYIFKFEVKEPEKIIDEEKKKQEELRKLNYQKNLKIRVLKKLYEEDKLPEHLKQREYLFKNFESTD